MLLVGIHVECNGTAIRVAQGDLKTFCQALTRVFTDFEAIDHHINIVLLILVELG